MMSFDKDSPNDELIPIDPKEAIELYLRERKQELSEASLQTHQSALKFFREYCEKKEIIDLNDLNGRTLHDYRLWRRDEAPTKVDTLSKKSEKTQQDIIRQFVRFAESIDAVKPGLHEKVVSPSLSKGEASREELLPSDRANEILNYLRKYQYGSIVHIVWVLLVNLGIRTGTLYGLDLEDYHPSANIPHFEIRHRPKTGTPLKNQEAGERCLSIDPWIVDLIDDYLDQRPEVTDEYGRKPLLTAGQGRLAKSTIRKYIYKMTRPCARGKDCPHGRDQNDCEATDASLASKCPSSQSAHTIRRGYITHRLKGDIDRSYVSERCNVSEEVIQNHYDQRDKYERMKARTLRDAQSPEGVYGGGRDES